MAIVTNDRPTPASTHINGTNQSPVDKCEKRSRDFITDDPEVYRTVSKAQSESLQINRFHRYLSSVAPIQYDFEPSHRSYPPRTIYPTAQCCRKFHQPPPSL